MDMESVAAGPEANDCDDGEAGVGMSDVGKVGLTGMATDVSVGEGTAVRSSGTVSSVVALLPFSITTWRTDATTVCVVSAAYTNDGCGGTLVEKAVLVLTSE